MASTFFVIGPGGDPGESGIWRRGPHPSLDKMVIGSNGLRKRGYDIHNITTWGNEAIERLALDIENEEKRWTL